MSAFDKEAFKSSMRGLSDSILELAKKLTVKNSERLENKSLSVIKAEVIDAAAKQFLVDPAVTLTNFSTVGAADNVFVNGTPTAMRAALLTRKVNKVIGFACIFAGSITPTDIPIDPVLPTLTVDTTLGDKGVLSVELIGDLLVRSFTFCFTYGVDLKVNVEFTQTAKSSNDNYWTKWVVSDQPLVNYPAAWGDAAKPTPFKVIYRDATASVNGPITFVNEDTFTGPDYLDDCIYIFTNNSDGSTIQMEAEAGVSLTHPRSTLLVSRPDNGAIVTARRLAKNTWHISGDLQQDLSITGARDLNNDSGQETNYRIRTSLLPSQRFFVQCASKAAINILLPALADDNDDFPIGGRIDFILESTVATVATIVNEHGSFIIKMPAGKQARVTGSGKTFSLVRKDSFNWWLLGELDAV